MCFFCFKQKTAYEMRISDWSSDVCSSDRSGPSRLHDLFVTHEAVTPGEFKRRGEGLTIRWGWQPSPFGDCLLLHTDRGMCGMAFAYATTATTTGGEDGRAAAFADMAGRWPRALLVEDPAVTAVLAARVFDPAARRGRSEGRRGGIRWCRTG